MKSFVSLLVPLLCLKPVMANYDYGHEANAAFKVMQDRWYNTTTGLWNNMWWESANIAEAVAKFGIKDSSFRPAAIDYISNTYAKSPNQNGYSNWRNEYYDDMGWWAMAWIASYDLTHEAKYLSTARDLFDAMTEGATTPCGGIWWNQNQTSIAAISNELYLSVGASLANRVTGNDKQAYLAAAHKQWSWISSSGVINADNLVNDGINKETFVDNNGVIHEQCKNDGKLTWTYNQGVLLAGLSELATADPSSSAALLNRAAELVHASTTRLVENGVLDEQTNPPLDQQAAMFKGAYIRSLGSLHRRHPRKEYAAFLKRNADSLLSKAKAADGVFEDLWQGGGRGSATAHAAGIDLLVAAVGA